MVSPYIASLYQGISQPRLEKYRPTGGSDLDMVTLYCWNMELAEALYPVLAALEVTFRNGMHHAIAGRENTGMWFWKILRPQDRTEFNKTMTRLGRRVTAPTAGQIVAELSFGFWTMLLGHNYHQILWNPNRAALVWQAFPNAPHVPKVRQYLEQHYRLIQELRNRIMHHEPIYYGMNWNKQSYPLTDLYARILEGIDWVNPTVYDTIQLSDRFEYVYRTGKQRIESDLRARFGLT